ncbi:LysR family transcriptional regulator [Cytophaga sp. FL35]|uniref:LysR family transcriptional regulator n=1 Tax=Cytophaga sp. FL35 TaxID=1904456 RepID=UPI001653C643|nr:LysR family transcriptional regulator [Cytophaga sp. FL35]MBC6999767.1 LysR family transcriptional regulator [Cytophaga sp. FL35]
MVNFEWYRTFVAIYENHTLTKAAKSLFTSQPGVSLHLNALESYVGRKLFERTSRKMIPTEEGKQLYNFITDPIQKLISAEQHFKKTSKENTASVHIGMCTETFQAILEPEIGQFEFDLVAKFGNHQELIKDLNNGLLDLVITPKMNNKSTLVEYEAFSKETIVLVAGNQTDVQKINRVLETKELALFESDLKSKTWYSASNEMEHFARFWFDNFKKRPDFKPNYILPNIGSIIRSLSGNNGLAVVPDFLVEKELYDKRLKLVWKGNTKVENTLYFATRKDLQFKREVSSIKTIFKLKMGDKL